MDKKTILKIILLALLLYPAGSLAFAGEYLQCVVIDVGEGQAVLLQRGEAGILIDTGHFGKKQELQEALQRYGAKRIEAVVLTHLHPDHASGIFGQMADYPQAVIYESGQRLAFHPFLDSYRWVIEKLDSGSWEVRQLRQGSAISWRNALIEVLWPAQPSGEDLNSQSLVLSVIFAGKTILIMGDVGKQQEDQLVQDKLLPGDVDVLVIGHHGAADATGSALLQWTSPEYAVVSVDSDNRRGYPDEMVVKKILESGARLHLTSENGDFVWRTPELKESD
ncbi:ComEC/Rec2 family competence protein [Desulfopila inferna]|uniref:ComEC/Rec2 family competence protein n=1 Tax=Desulfopila inferna TaxID=468528 RepID=UPI0019651E9F|nr:MBL fold metallo-hydrolase [Desulfopila inferna]MBM9603310.1 MBL fold metallo-hydrolase [Desulfopila inferna]